jgi:aminoglycoside phosphotransferase (APT) family kinase protein
MTDTGATAPEPQPWAPEHVVGPAEAATLIADLFPALSPVTVSPLGAGFDNTAYVVNGDWVFRFPRRAFAVPLLETERQLLPLVARHLPVAVPEPAYCGEATTAFPWPFYGYRLLGGETACRANPTADQRRQMATGLGRSLAAPHRIPVAEAAAQGAAPDQIRRLDVAYRLGRGEAALATLVQDGAIADPIPTRQALQALADPTPGQRPIVLAHGDLYARHLIVDGNGRLTGIIDWGDLHLGDPALDLSIGPYFLPPDAWPAFCDAYGPISDETWRLARFRTLVHALLVQVYATDIQDADLLKEARTGHDQVLASLH